MTIISQSLPIAPTVLSHKSVSASVEALEKLGLSHEEIEELSVTIRNIIGQIIDDCLKESHE